MGVSKHKPNNCSRTILTPHRPVNKPMTPDVSLHFTGRIFRSSNHVYGQGLPPLHCSWILWSLFGLNSKCLVSTVPVSISSPSLSTTHSYKSHTRSFHTSFSFPPGGTEERPHRLSFFSTPHFIEGLLHYYVIALPTRGLGNPPIITCCWGGRPLYFDDTFCTRHEANWVLIGLEN